MKSECQLLNLRTAVTPSDCSHEFTKDGGATHVCMSMQEVADALGISRERVRQLERRALHKIRLAMMDELRESNPMLALEVAWKEREYQMWVERLGRIPKGHGRRAA